MGTLVSLAELTAGLAFGLWLGATLAVSFLVTPRLFGLFAAADAERAVGDLLPRQYRIGVGLSVVGLLATVAVGVLSGFDIFAAASVAGGEGGDEHGERVPRGEKRDHPAGDGRCRGADAPVPGRSRWSGRPRRWRPRGPRPTPPRTPRPAG